LAHHFSERKVRANGWVERIGGLHERSEYNPTGSRFSILAHHFFYKELTEVP